MLRGISEIHEFSEMVDEAGPIVEDPIASILKISDPKILLCENVFPLAKHKTVPWNWLASLADLHSVTSCLRQGAPPRMEARAATSRESVLYVPVLLRRTCL